jgi:chromosomal replication initiation ATPase DnaA
VAMNVKDSVRELEGVLRQIIGESQIFNKVPTIPATSKIIQIMNNAHEIV